MEFAVKMEIKPDASTTKENDLPGGNDPKMKRKVDSKIIITHANEAISRTSESSSDCQNLVQDHGVLATPIVLVKPKYDAEALGRSKA